MKKIIPLFLLILSLPLILTSCISITQLNDKAIVQAIGVDYENDKYKLTFQIFSPSSENGSGLSASANNAKIIEAEGETISQAIQSATLVQGKILFVGQCDVLVIGTDLAKKGLTPAITYFDTVANARKNMHVLISESKASDILKAKINQDILPAKSIEKIIRNTQKNGLLFDRRLFDLLRAFENQYESATLPIVKIKKKDSKKEEENVATAAGGKSSGDNKEESQDGEIEEISSIEIFETAVISDTKFAATLNKEETTGLLFLNNNISTAVLTTSTEKYEKASIEIYKSSTSITPAISGDNVTFKVAVNADAFIAEAVLQKGETVSLKDISEIESSCSEKIKEYIKAVFDKAVKKNKADIFNLNKIVWKKYPDFFKKMKNQWPQVLENSTIEVNCTLRVERLGLQFDTEHHSK